MSAVRLALLLLAGALLCACGEKPDATLLRLDEARMEAVVDGRPVAPRTVSLPLHWDIVFGALSGEADFTLRFARTAGTQKQGEPYKIFIARLGNAYQVDLNGVRLASGGSVATPHDRWSAKHPVTVTFPDTLLSAENQIHVRIRADGGSRGGLSHLLVGPSAAISDLEAQSHWWRVSMPQAASVFSLLVSCFCALLWWQQHDALYAWAALGEALWAVTVADTVVETAPLPWPYWGLTLLLLRAVWAWSLYAIAEQVFGRRPDWERRSMLAIQSGVLVCLAFLVALRSTEVLKLWYVVEFIGFGIVIARLIRDAAIHVRADRVLMIVTLVACVAATLRDAVAGRWDASLYEESAWAKYVATMVGATVMWIVSTRFLQARNDVLRLNASLVERIAEKELELRRSFESLSQARSASAVTAERERILRDMHDGVGANLATAVRQLESGRAQTTDVIQTLRESLDHLKLSIDAMNLPAGDVNALLASLRYRLQPRIQSAGLCLRWEVDALPSWAPGTDLAMRHLQFLLLEAFSNTLQHAGAETIVLTARALDEDIEITLNDDGRGIDALSERGLRSMRERARAIGARFTVSPVSPGTQVRVLLPTRLPQQRGGL